MKDCGHNKMHVRACKGVTTATKKANKSSQYANMQLSSYLCTREQMQARNIKKRARARADVVTRYRRARHHNVRHRCVRHAVTRVYVIGVSPPCPADESFQHASHRCVSECARVRHRQVRH